ncbi:hypothetical protein [Arsenophonus nasoniae]|uniref:hypothetical protein n=1 Tax=Arsenophonus nasoniae TaxID=638 RepID=UPI003879BC65
MQTPNNILRFNEITGFMLAHLYKVFPVKKSFELSKLFPEAKIDSENFSFNSATNIVNKEATFVSDTIIWLIESGYMSGVVKNLHSIENAVLTAKGLELLKLSPDSLCGASFGDELIKATKSGVKEVITNVASQVLTSGITLLYKTIIK